MGVRTLGIALLISAASVACASAAPRGRVYVKVAPPPAIVEVRSVAPGPGHVWVGGFYRWEHNRYVWVRGRWVVPPHPKAVWVPGHWQHSPRGHFWVEGRWR
jgi:hypothetical protein